MGTRSVTYIHEQDGTPIACLYRQYDGYIGGGHGEDLAKFLTGKVLVNGIGHDDGHIFNGMGDVAARIVGHFVQSKGGENVAGGFYMVNPADPEAGKWCDYTYHVWPNGEPDVGKPAKECKISVEGYSGPIGDGRKWTAKNFVAKATAAEGTDEDD